MYGLRYRGALDATTQAELEGLIATLQEFLLLEHNEDGSHRPVQSSVIGVPIGTIVQWPVTTPPQGWLLCDGRPVSRTTYARLFSVLGTAYGAGNGVDTFTLPDGRGRFLLGSFSGASVATTGGEWDHKHGIDGEAAHTHTGTTDSDGAHTHTALESGDDLALDYEPGDGGNLVALNEVDHEHDTSSNGAHTHTFTTGASGSHDHGGETDEANPPYLTVNHIILAGA